MREIGRTVRVGQPVGEPFGERLAVLQRIDRRVGVVQRVDVGTVGTDPERAVGPDDLDAVCTGRAGWNRRQAAACAFRAGADAGDRQFGMGVVYVAVLTGGPRRHVATYRNRVFVNRIDVIDCFGRIVHWGNGRVDEHAVVGIGIDGRATRVGDIHSGTGSGRGAAGFDEPGRQAGGRAVPVFNGHETHLGIGLEDQAVVDGNRRGDVGPGRAVVGGILPPAFGRCLIGHANHDHAVEGIRRGTAIACLVVLQVLELGTDQTGDRRARRIGGVFVDGGQAGRCGVRARRRIVHCIDGDVNRGGGGLWATGANVAPVVVNRSERYRVHAVVVAARGVPEGGQRAVDVGQRAGQGQRLGIVGAGGDCRPRQTTDSYAARGDADGHGVVRRGKGIAVAEDDFWRMPGARTAIEGQGAVFIHARRDRIGHRRRFIHVGDGDVEDFFHGVVAIHAHAFDAVAHASAAVVSDDRDGDQLVYVRIVRRIAQRIERGFHLSRRAGNLHCVRVVARDCGAVGIADLQFSVGRGIIFGRQGDGNEIRCTLVGVSDVSDIETGKRYACAGSQDGACRHLERRRIVDRHDGDGLVQRHRVSGRLIGVSPIGECRAQIECAVA